MARNYSIDGQDTNTVSTTILELRSTTAIRPRIYYVTCGSDATPGDEAAEYALTRTTTAGTSTAVTPRPLDPDDPAAVATAGEAHSAEPTYTADVILLQWAQNQRATFQWHAQPGREIVLPAAANGVGAHVETVTTAFNANMCMHFEE